MRRENPCPDADFDLLRGGFKETCARIAMLEAGAQGPVSTEVVMLRFAEGLPQNRDGLVEARARADARLAELERVVGRGQ